MHAAAADGRGESAVAQAARLLGDAEASTLSHLRVLRAALAPGGHDLLVHPGVHEQVVRRRRCQLASA